MKTRKTIITHQNITLDPDEWFSAKARDGRVLVVDSILASQPNEGGRWDLTFVGSRVRKDGSYGSRLRLDQWTMTQTWSFTKPTAMFDLLPQEIRSGLAEIGVSNDG